MPRWRQTLNPETGKHEFVPVDDAARAIERGAIHGDIQSFVSPVDGTVISDRKQLREHNKRNNVVSAGEFTPEFYARKAEERANFYQGKHARNEKLKRKQEIYENIMRLERNGN